MTSIPTGGSRPPLSPLSPNVPARLATRSALTTDGVLSTLTKTRTAQQIADYPGASLQNRQMISPLKLVPAYVLPSSPLPISRMKTPLTKESKAKIDSNPDLKELSTRLFADPDFNADVRIKLDGKFKKKEDKDALKALNALKIQFQTSASASPSRVFCVPVGARSDSVAHAVLNFAGSGNPLDSISASELDNNNNKLAIADKKLLQKCLAELFEDFKPSDDFTADNLWLGLRGAENPNKHDKRNFLITVVQFKDGSELKFFSVSGRPDVKPDDCEVSYSLFGACNTSQPSVVTLPLLPNKPEAGRVSIEANYDYLEPVPNAKFIHLTYADISTQIDGVDYEMREVPRTVLSRLCADKETVMPLDRARDTEFVVLNALAAIKKAYPEKFAQGFDITMFSKLKMCPSCKGAATYSRTSAMWGQHGDFRIYGAAELSKEKHDEMWTKISKKQ